MTSTAVKCSSLRDDGSGAVVVMAIPMAFLLIGFLYYAIGVGDAIIRRETLQDAADASAFSAAVMMARGMNLVVLINVIMASLLAILVMLRIVQIALLTGIGISILLAYPTFGASLATLPSMKAAVVSNQKAYESARRVVKPMIEGLHATTKVIKYAMPVAMEARVVHTSLQYRPAAVGGFAIPSQLAMPIEPGTEAELCGKAGAYAGTLLTLPLEVVLPDFVLDEMRGAFEGVTTTLAAYFCSFQGGQPPAIELPAGTLRQRLPKLPKAKECEDQVATGTEVDPRHQRACDEAQAEVIASEPHRRTGECDADECSAYHLRKELARTECSPPGRPALEDWMWQEREVFLSAVRHPNRWPYPDLIEHNDVEYGDPVLRTGTRPPCGTRGDVAEEWNSNVAEPLCVEVHADLAPAGAWKREDGDPLLEVRYREVLQVFGCSRKVPRVTPQLDRDPAAEPGSPLASCDGQAAGRVHHNVKACANLGDETFQLRAVVLGTEASASAWNVMDTVVYREAEPASTGSSVDLGAAVQQASRLYVAQAEYYFDHDGTPEALRDRKAWMWSMDWRARLVRFRLRDDLSPDGCAEPQSQGQTDRSQGSRRDPGRCGVEPPSETTAKACEVALSARLCGGIDSAIGALNGLFIH